MATKKAVPADPDGDAKQDAEMDGWRAESDLRTLMEAAAIQKDKPRLARAKAKAKEQLAALTAAAATK